MKEVVLITGANGTVAKSVSKILQNNFEIRYLTRKSKRENEFEWDVENKFIDSNAFTNVKHIIHLAGAGIADKKWSKKRRKTILSSRVDSSKLILNTLTQQHLKINSFISASAIGYYGTQTSTTIYSEDMNKGNDFLGDVCFKWENVAKEFQKQGVCERTVILRLGIVLSKEGGALKKMMTPIKYYVGAALGSGKQYMPWIHITDLSYMIKYALENSSLKGVYNAVSPEYITNQKFTATLAKEMKKPMFFLNIPSFILYLIFGERATLLLKGSRVSSKKIIREGFKFKYNDLKSALQNLLNEQKKSE
ncbi:TIGR01777 family oxidoreductase [Tenacibaculum sp. UWU-22]|uniref:TIGR01777 family oxidoreductase n=1 Tax=Tenacibaculum sp. UWU-22 TaxID=3234187 RepID=UPI0034DB3D81